MKENEPDLALPFGSGEPQGLNVKGAGYSDERNEPGPALVVLSPLPSRVFA